MDEDCNVRTHLENIANELVALNSRDDARSAVRVRASYDTENRVMTVCITCVDHAYFGNAELAIEFRFGSGRYVPYPDSAPTLSRLRNENDVFHPLLWTTETLKAATDYHVVSVGIRDTRIGHSKRKWRGDTDSISSYYVDSVIALLDLDTYPWPRMRGFFCCACCPTSRAVIERVATLCATNTPFMLCEREGFDVYKSFVKHLYK